MANREDLSIQELVVLLSIIGSIEDGVRFDTLDDIEYSLVKTGFVLAFDVPAFTRIDSPYTFSKDVVKKFTQTLRGEMHLSLWTIEELLEIVLTYGEENTFRRKWALICIVRRSPLELLPEFLAHPYDRIRIAAEARMRELQNGT